MRFYSFICAMMIALLSGCGGGGGSSSAVNPIPAPPPQQRNASLTDLKVDDLFDATATVLNFTVAKGSGAATVKSDGTQGYTLANTDVRYDAATRGYSLRLGSSATAPSFNEMQRDAGSSNAVLSTYARVSGATTEDFVLFNPGPANTKLALTYTSYGAYQSMTDRGTNLEVVSAFFAFGVRTAASDLPRSGSATYNTLIDGQFVNSSGVYALSGSSAFSADFDTSKISYTIVPVGTHILNGSTLSFGRFSGPGSIDTATASFQSAGLVFGPYVVSLSGFFYGPAAAEIGGVFAFGGGAGAGTGQGALVGKKN
ncbi:MAG: Transferrin binding protein-like solute binding protein [Chthoniobacter sp.]|nr:Transferrin binding protein-like solute binding protein [Chthoniobacter sp.]